MKFIDGKTFRNKKNCGREYEVGERVIHRLSVNNSKEKALTQGNEVENRVLWTTERE